MFVIAHMQAKRAMLEEDYAKMSRFKWAAIVMNIIALISFFVILVVAPIIVICVFIAIFSGIRIEF